MISIHRETIAKALGYRLAGVATTSIIAYLILGDPAPAIAVGAWSELAKFGIYVVYDEMWDEYVTR